MTLGGVLDRNNPERVIPGHHRGPLVTRLVRKRERQNDSRLHHHPHGSHRSGIPNARARFRPAYEPTDLPVRLLPTKIGGHDNGCVYPSKFGIDVSLRIERRDKFVAMVG